MINRKWIEVERGAIKVWLETCVKNIEIAHKAIDRSEKGVNRVIRAKGGGVSIYKAESARMYALCDLHVREAEYGMWANRKAYFEKMVKEEVK